MRSRPHRFARAALAVVVASVVLAVVAPLSPRRADALPTEAIPLASIGAAPRSGTLPNGVSWTVDRGAWDGSGQGYVIFGGQTQTWTFNRTVSLRFSVRGLTGAGECMAVPVGSVLASLAPSHTYNATTRQVCFRTNVPSADSFFTLSSTNSLVLVAPAVASLGRGPGVIEVTFTETPALSIVKSSTATTLPAVGQAIPYTFQVTNTGNVPMTDVVVSDPNTTGMSCAATVLAVGATTACTAVHTVTQTDVDAGAVVNTATVSGIPPSGTRSAPVSSNQVTITGQRNPALAVLKSSTAAIVPPVGQTIPYSFLVTNTGNVTVNGLSLADPNATAMSCPTGTLAPGAATTCTAFHTVTQGDLDAGAVNNTANVSGTTLGGPIGPVSSNRVTITGQQHPRLSIVKSSTTTQLPVVGASIPYRFTVTNLGDVTMANVVIVDALAGAVTCPQTTLVPGVSTTCSASHIVTQADIDGGGIVNTATVTGTPPGGSAIAPTASNTLTIPTAPTPALSLVKSSTTTAILTLGELVPYTFTVTNIGNVTMTAVQVTDPHATPVSCPPTTLAPGASVTCTATHTVDQADLDAGAIANTASVVGTPPSGPQIAAVPSNEVVVPVVQTESLSILKSTSAATLPDVGADITYSLLVSNTGNVTIHDIAVDDPNATGIACLTTSLAPGSSTSCTAAHTVTQADADTGAVVNTAVASAMAPDGSAIPQVPSNTVTLTGDSKPALSIVKSSTTTAIDHAGQAVDYTFTITNTGNVTVHDIAVDDPNIADVTCPQTALAPGTTVACTATYEATTVDLDAGQIVNTATVTGTTPDGIAVPATPSNTTTIAAAQIASLSIVKATPTQSATAGDTIPFTFAVTNAGNVTIRDVVVNDPNAVAITCPQTVLAAAATMMCIASHTVDQADVDAGRVTNIASVVGMSPAEIPTAVVVSNQVIIPIVAPTIDSPDPATTTTTSPPATPPADPILPATGNDTTWPMRVIAAVLLAGCLLVAIGRRTRARSRH